MEDIPAQFIIDEMINKLETVKSGDAHHSAIKELSAVRAYCDLLLKTLETNAGESDGVKMHLSQSPIKSEGYDDAKDGSLLDF